MYTVITNGFSSIYCACTILKSRGQRYPCHFLCQRSWVTCGKDIDQGRLIYVPAIVSTVDFLFLFMSCALFLRSRIRVRWKSTARQLRKSGDDYDIIHTLYSPLPHSVCEHSEFAQLDFVMVDEHTPICCRGLLPLLLACSRFGYGSCGCYSSFLVLPFLHGCRVPTCWKLETIFFTLPPCTTTKRLRLK